MPKKNLKLGEMLIRAGIIDEFQLNSALSHQRNLGGRLGNSLVKLGYISENRLLSFLADQLNCPRIDLAKEQIPPELVAMLPEEKARQFNVLPVRRGEMSGTVYLLVAMSDPTNLMVIDSLQFMTGCRIRPAIASEEAIREALNRFYGASDSEDEELAEAEVLVESTETLHKSSPVSPPARQRTTEEKLQALLEKLKALGILTPREYEELK
ncbi:hypothetical protein [Geothermobacter hydrogeniphilus]|uniref:Type II secretion system protein GspE N-terminal domain-containing protein n=1 Tax=Geothermobacter hydrogeniphilus TaxID=1969733 RepID=A0A1X0Y8K4_9BACT|nr:hypothetical protein [Geothermobacter hydrogeniphilus]ORJ61540.1 hypothetical protein B5V00_05745 [Geothermobacter hydrogeniphilus]